MNFHDASFWEQKWQEARKNSVYGREVPARSGREYWDMRSEGFAKQGGSDEVMAQLAAAIHRLSHHGSARGDMRLLDIGCGPGNYSVPLAGRFQEVIALDPSPEMLKLLQHRAGMGQVTNIKTVQYTWEDVDLAALGWLQSFDVVLAMMTPGINDAVTLRKMINASKRTCLVAGHLRREDRGRKELWGQLLGGEMPAVSMDVFYIFHLLFAWGFCPSIELDNRVSTKQKPIEQGVKDLKISFYPYMEITPEVERVIQNYVQSHSTGGVYREERFFTSGYVLWDV